MIRRVEQNETFHGTAAGQAPSVADLAARLALTERQAQCAALLRMGNSRHRVAETLGISISTLESHLAELRRIFEVASTEQLALRLAKLIPDHELDAFHCWPAQTNAVMDATAADPVFAARLRKAFSLEQGLTALQEKLGAYGVLHVYYCFLPHSVQGFLRGDLIDVFLGPREIEAAFQSNGGLLGQPIALTLFESPTDVPVISLKEPVDSDDLAGFYTQCRNHGATHLLALGFPAGAGFVGMALTLTPPARTFDFPGPEQAALIRSDAMAMHAAMLTNGALAARVRLTLRERNALSALALGKRAADAATELNVSERAFAKLLSSARGKLNARTNAEAVGKAVLLNALVFL